MMPKDQKTIKIWESSDFRFYQAHVKYKVKVFQNLLGFFLMNSKFDKMNFVVSN